MMQSHAFAGTGRPWQAAIDDEWLPRQLRLCFGSPSGDSGPGGDAPSGDSITGDGDFSFSDSTDGGGFQGGGFLGGSNEGTNTSSSNFGESTDGGGFQSTSSGFSDSGGGFQGDGGAFSGSFQGDSTGGGGMFNADSLGGQLSSDVGGSLYGDSGQTTGGGPFGGGPGGGQQGGGGPFGDSTTGQGGPFGTNTFADTPTGGAWTSAVQAANSYGANNQGDPTAIESQGMSRAADAYQQQAQLNDAANIIGRNDSAYNLNSWNNPTTTIAQQVNDEPNTATIHGRSDDLSNAINTLAGRGQDLSVLDQPEFQQANPNIDLNLLDAQNLVAPPLNITPVDPSVVQPSERGAFGPPQSAPAFQSRSGMDMDFNPSGNYQAPAAPPNQGTQGFQGGRSEAPSLLDMLNPISQARADTNDLVSSTQFNQSLNQLGQQYGRDAAMDQLSRGMDQFYADSRANMEAQQGGRFSAPYQGAFSGPDVVGSRDAAPFSSKGDMQSVPGRGDPAHFANDFNANFNPNNVQPSLDYALPRGDINPSLNIYQNEAMGPPGQFSGQQSAGNENATPGRGDRGGDPSQTVSNQQIADAYQQAQAQNAQYQQQSQNEGRAIAAPDFISTTAQQTATPSMLGQPGWAMPGLTTGLPAGMFLNSDTGRANPFGDPSMFNPDTFAQTRSNDVQTPGWLNPTDLTAGVRGGQEMFQGAPQSFNQAMQASRSGDPNVMAPPNAAMPWGTTFAPPTAYPSWDASQQVAGVRGNADTLARSQETLQQQYDQTQADRQAAIERATTPVLDRPAMVDVPLPKDDPRTDLRAIQRGDIPLPTPNPLDVDVRTDPSTRTQSRQSEQQQSRQDDRAATRVTVNPERSGPPLTSRSTTQQSRGGQQQQSGRSGPFTGQVSRGQLDSLLNTARTAPTLQGRVAALDQLNGIISAMKAAGLPNPFGRDPDPGINAALRQGR